MAVLTYIWQIWQKQREMTQYCKREALGLRWLGQVLSCLSAVCYNVLWGSQVRTICCHSARFCRHGDGTQRGEMRDNLSVDLREAAVTLRGPTPGACGSGPGASTGKSFGSSLESFKISSQTRFWVSLTESETYLTKCRKKMRRNGNLASLTSS